MNELLASYVETIWIVFMVAFLSQRIVNNRIGLSLPYRGVLIMQIKALTLGYIFQLAYETISYASIRATNAYPLFPHINDLGTAFMWVIWGIYSSHLLMLISARSGKNITWKQAAGINLRTVLWTWATLIAFSIPALLYMVMVD